VVAAGGGLKGGGGLTTNAQKNVFGHLFKKTLLLTRKQEAFTQKPGEKEGRRNRLTDCKKTKAWVLKGR